MADHIPPDCASRFRIERLLGRGGFGAVYRATQLELERPVALKVLSSIDPEQASRFLTEARVTAALSSPHIVRVLDHGADHGVPWIAYELIEGGSARELLDRGPLPAGTALTIAAQVAAALEEAHAHGVIHRDIKPDNVLLARPDHHVVADFGIARWAEGAAVRTASGVILGTPAYIAPEVIEGAPAAESADLYALAVMLYEMLTGRVPFEDEDTMLVLERHLKSAPRPPSALREGIPPDVEQLVLRALAKRPEERFGSAQAFRAAALSLVQPDRPRPAARKQKAVPRRGVRRAAAVMLAVTALAMTLAVRWLVRRPAPPPEPPPASASAATPAASPEEELERWLAGLAESPDRLEDARRRLTGIERVERPIRAPDWIRKALFARLDGAVQTIDREIGDLREKSPHLDLATLHAGKLERVREMISPSGRPEKIAALQRAAGRALDASEATVRALFALELAAEQEYDVGFCAAAAQDDALLLEVQRGGELAARYKRWTQGRSEMVVRHIFDAVRSQRVGKHMERTRSLEKAIEIATARPDPDEKSRARTVRRVALLHAQLIDATREWGSPADCHRVHARWLEWKRGRTIDAAADQQDRMIAKACRQCSPRR